VKRLCDVFTRFTYDKLGKETRGKFGILQLGIHREV
jgi:hypothetical protein